MTSHEATNLVAGGPRRPNPPLFHRDVEVGGRSFSAWSVDMW